MILHVDAAADAAAADTGRPGVLSYHRRCENDDDDDDDDDTHA